MWQFGNNSCEDGAVFMRISITYADWIQQKSEYCYHSGQPKSDSSRQLRWVRSFRAKKMVKTFSCGHFSNENSVKPVIPSLFLLLTSFMIATKQENISRYIVSKWKYLFLFLVNSYWDFKNYFTVARKFCMLCISVRWSVSPILHKINLATGSRARPRAKSVNVPEATIYCKAGGVYRGIPSSDTPIGVGARWTSFHPN